MGRIRTQSSVCSGAWLQFKGAGAAPAAKGSWFVWAIGMGKWMLSPQVNSIC